MQEHYRSGVQNGVALYRLLRERGYRGSAMIVRRELGLRGTCTAHDCLVFAEKPNGVSVDQAGTPYASLRASVVLRYDYRLRKPERCFSGQGRDHPRCCREGIEQVLQQERSSDLLDGVPDLVIPPLRISDA